MTYDRDGRGLSGADAIRVALDWIGRARRCYDDADERAQAYPDDPQFAELSRVRAEAWLSAARSLAQAAAVSLVPELEPLRFYDAWCIEHVRCAVANYRAAKEAA